MFTRLRRIAATPKGFSFTLFLVALVVRFLTFALFPHPGYPDASYYVSVARELAAGHGLNIPYMWAFVEVGSRVPALGALPLPAFAHWMPLASLIQLPFIVLLGPSDLASALPFILLAAMLAPLTYRLGRDLLGRESTARIAGGLAVTGVSLAPYLSQPDNYALYAFLVVGCFWLVARVLRGLGRPNLQLAIAGVLAGLAVLSRNDGVLLFLTVGAIWLFGQPWRKQANRPRLSLRGLLIFGLAGLVVMAPWFARQLIEFGSLFPSSVSGRILFIREYDEMFSADGPLNLSYLLSWGIGPLLQSRVLGLGVAFFLWALYPGAVVLAPLALVGAWAHRRVIALRPWFVWIAIFWLWSGLIATVHLTSGNFIHSASAVLPLTMILIAAGFEATMAGAARRWPSWDAPAGSRRLLAGLLAIAIIMGAISTGKSVSLWIQYRDAYTQVTTYLNANGPADARVMSSDPGEVWLVTGHPGIQTPNSDAAITKQALDNYGIRWVVLDPNSIVPTFADLITGRTTYPFLSAKPVFTVPNSMPGARYPLMAVYAVLPTSP